MKIACAQCGQECSSDGAGTGYGIRANGDKVCYACCASIDRADMVETGRAVLYLNTTKKHVANWPGTLAFPCVIKKGRHNIAGVRYDVWFIAGGREWHGVKYGDMTDLCHCKRLKGL